MKTKFIPSAVSGRYYPQSSETDRDAKPRVESGQIYPGYYKVAPATKPRVVADLPLPLVKFIHRFATRCSLDCCGWAALAFDEPCADDARWAIELRVKNEFARVRDTIENSSAELLWFPQLQLGASKDVALVFFGWFEDGLRKMSD